MSTSGNRSLKIVIIGPPGSGKGTQARLLAARLGVPHISVGALLRAEIVAGSPLGERVDGAVAAGELVADADIATVLREALQSAAARDGWILDGAPRTEAQAAALAPLLESHDSHAALVIALEAPEEELRSRLLDRARVEDRVDDTPSVISHRLVVWAEESRPILARYEERGMLVRVDGTGDVEAIAARVLDAVDAAFAPRERDRRAGA
ncbi:MAG: adenylate kinase family protein [Acidimicrobiia bacterium]